MCPKAVRSGLCASIPNVYAPGLSGRGGPLPLGQFGRFALGTGGQAGRNSGADRLAAGKPRWPTASAPAGGSRLRLWGREEHKGVGVTRGKIDATGATAGARF